MWQKQERDGDGMGHGHRNRDGALAVIAIKPIHKVIMLRSLTIESSC